MSIEAVSNFFPQEHNFSKYLYSHRFFLKPCDSPPQDKFLEIDLLDQKICKIQIKSFHIHDQTAFSGFTLILIYCFSFISNVPAELVLSFVHFLGSLETLRDMGCKEPRLCYLLTKQAELSPCHSHAGVCLPEFHLYREAPRTTL